MGINSLHFFLCFIKPVELMNGTVREHSLICKGPVEVLVLDKEVRISQVIQKSKHLNMQSSYRDFQSKFS